MRAQTQRRLRWSLALIAVCFLLGGTSGCGGGPAYTEPEVKGLGIAPGARRPGAKKAPAAPKPAAPQPEPAADSESSAAPEPSAEGNGETSAPPVKGLGIAKGARPPGKR